MALSTCRCRSVCTAVGNQCCRTACVVSCDGLRTCGQVRECYVAMISRGTTQMRCSLAHSIAVVAALLGSPACRNVWMAHTRSATCLAAHVSGTLLNAPLHGHWLIARLWSTIANLRRAGPEISTNELLPIFSSLLWDSNVEIAEAAAYEIHRSRPSWN